MARTGSHEIDRRHFLAQGAAATAAALAGGTMVGAAPTGPKVAVVRDKSKKVVQGRTIDAAIAQKLVDRAVMACADKDDASKAWATYVQPKDKVAIKFNGLFPNATTHPEIVDAVLKGLIGAGVRPDNIVVYDRASKDFKTTGFGGEGKRGGAILRATGEAYGPSTKAGPVDTKLSKILLEADALINLSIMKTHVLAGVSGALKNHLGTVPNAKDYHPGTCRAVADLNALAEIKGKTRLCICDALYGLFDGGPAYRPRSRWDYYGVIASTDPVAHDATLADIIKAKRVAEGKSPYYKPIVHIERAAELDLGCADLKSIHRIAVDI